MSRALALHLAVPALLLGLHFVLPDYHHGVMARILVLAVYALGYNLLFGYTGLLSLGHALHFGAGVYGAGLTMLHLGWPAWAGLLAGLAAGTLSGALTGLLALRTIGVGFMIVTLMFAQAGFLTSLHFSEWTLGDEGFVIPQATRAIGALDLSDGDTRYLAALALFTAALLLKFWLVGSRTGRVMVAIRENEERTRMLGFATGPVKLMALTLSAAYAGAAGACFAVFFGYVGATFLTIEYSILPLLWVLVGGAGTVLGPLLGAVAMFYVVEWAKEITDAYMIVVGAALVVLILVARKGLLGALRARLPGWLP